MTLKYLVVVHDMILITILAVEQVFINMVLLGRSSLTAITVVVII